MTDGTMPTLQSNAKCKRWEVWLAYVKYEDFSAEKRRPVLILDDDCVYVLAASITGHSPRAGFRGEYEIQDWKGAGLGKQSTVRLSKKAEIVHRNLIHKMGDLQAVDIANILKLNLV